jgi:hypothetical protein
MMHCPVHGFSGVCIYSPALLQMRADGTFPEVVIIEIKDRPEEEAFFRINVTPEEAAELPVVDGRIPFDLDSAEIMDRLIESCSRCLSDRRRELGEGNP